MQVSIFGHYYLVLELGLGETPLFGPPTQSSQNRIVFDLQLACSGSEFRQLKNQSIRG